MTGSTPEAYLEKLKFETERWTKVVKDNGIKIEGRPICPDEGATLPARWSGRSCAGPR
jgi:hypothetical protein